MELLSEAGAPSPKSGSQHCLDWSPLPPSLCLWAVRSHLKRESSGLSILEKCSQVSKWTMEGSVLGKQRRLVIIKKRTRGKSTSKEKQSVVSCFSRWTPETSRRHSRCFPAAVAELAPRSVRDPVHFLFPYLVSRSGQGGVIFVLF